MDIPPGLVSDSYDSCDSGSETPWENESSDEDWVPATPTKTKKTKKKTQSKTKSQSSVEEVYEGVAKACLRQESERQKTTGLKKKRRKKGKDYARNYTFASKMQCLDHSIIEEFLASSVCGCKKKCLKKLNEMKEHGAADCVYQLRKQRFASKCCRCHQSRAPPRSARSSPRG